MNVSEEILDVVDENDAVVAQKTRGEIHARGLMHRAVHILVFNNPGELLLQLRSMSKDENPGLWDSSAAGHVDSGETYLQCARREIEEELGIVPTIPLEFLFKLPASAANGYEHSKIYRYFYDGPFSLQRAEIDASCWINQRSMDKRVEASDPSLTGTLVLIWRQYRELDHKITAKD